MAKVTKTFTEKEVMKPVKVKVTTFTLELSLEEAIVVYNILGEIGNNGQARKCSNAVYHALDGLPQISLLDAKSNPWFRDNADFNLENAVKNYEEKNS